MKLALIKHHFDFFYQNHFIEFENLLSQEVTNQLREILTAHIKAQLTPTSTRDKIPFETRLLKAGFDSWRFSNFVKKWVFYPHFAEIAAHLTKRKKLRIGFDQAFYAFPFFSEENRGKILFLKENFLISQISSLKKMVCGLILNVSKTPFPTILKKETTNSLTLPSLPGNGIFFSINKPLCLNHLVKNSKETFLLIVYAEEKTVYFLNRENPHTHDYKKLGYVFGDKLQNKTHPILYPR